jgi:hypothetical protein
VPGGSNWNLNLAAFGDDRAAGSCNVNDGQEQWFVVLGADFA